MGDSGVLVGEQVDWEHLLHNTCSTPEDLNFFDIEFDPYLLPNLSPDYDLSNPSVDEVEQLLMKDNKFDVPNHEFSNGFLSDILLDSPLDCDESGEVFDISNGKNSVPLVEEDKEKNDAFDLDHEANRDKSDGDADGPTSKKRKRQLRNRDAAIRSRERKKMYVRDLEMKSRYYEGEWKRLGILLQCLLAENQALHLSLQNSRALDASMTKQESAVLLLESLLLGSLLWFLGIVCLLILPRPLQPRLGAVPLESVETRKVGSKMCGPLVLKSFMLGKRCKASRSRMRPSSFTHEVLV